VTRVTHKRREAAIFDGIRRGVAATRRIHARLSALPIRAGGVAESMLLVLLACCISLGQGQDRNWDLRNYHLYNAFSFLQGRFDIDLNAVGIQTYFNPLLDLPYYILSVRLIPDWPRMVAFLAGIPFGLLIVVVLRIARLALPSDNDKAAWLAPIATALGVTGAMTWSEIGTTYGDIPIAVIVLTGLLMPLPLLPQRESIQPQRWMLAMAGAGFLIGGAAGLKLTACLYAPAALLALSLTAGTAKRTVGGAVVFCAGWVVGLALFGGWWMLTLYQHFGNPLFPQFNQVFASPWIPVQSFDDVRFMPRSTLQAVFYPFFWALKPSHQVSEVGLRDPRFALAYIAIALLACAGLHRMLSRRDGMRPTMASITTALGIFMVMAFVAWETEFSLPRFAIGLEALSGIMIIRGAQTVATWCWPALPARPMRIVASLLLAVAIAASSRPDWGRLRHYDSQVFDVHAPSIPDGATIALADRPIGFIVPFLQGRDVSFVGIADVLQPGRLAEAVQHRVRDAASLLVLIDKPPAAYTALLQSYGRRIDASSCKPIANTYDRELRLCAAE
jgi:hypothetical protein